jgi:NAD-dependent oxidoreductase involved in siderophore biosynthesis
MSNQTFAGMIARWKAKECQHSECGNAICEACSELHAAASEAQAIETRLRALSKEWREMADKAGYASASSYRARANQLDAILGPEQAGERTSG